MTQIAATERQPKTVPMWQFIVAVFLTISVMAGVGIFVGQKFFWVDAEILQARKELSYYEAMVKKDPADLESRVALAYRYYVLGKYSEAISHLQATLDFDDKYYDAYLNLGYVYFAMEDYDLALENYEKASEIVTDDYKPLLNLGVTYYKMGKYDKSFEFLDKAKKARPGSADIYYHNGVAAELSGDIEGAIGEYEEALKYDPNYEEAKDALKKLTRG